MSVPEIHVVMRDPSLRRAVAARIGRDGMFGGPVVGEALMDVIPPGEVVVTTAMDCPPEAARRFVDGGASVIVLTPIAREEEEARYLRAGVLAYIPMAIDAYNLMGALRAALENRHGWLSGAPAPWLRLD